MKLSERQKKVIQLIDNETYTVSVIERYYNEDPLTMGGRKNSNVSFYVRMVNKVNAFMTAVNGFLEFLDETVDEKIDENDGKTA